MQDDWKGEKGKVRYVIFASNASISAVLVLEYSTSLFTSRRVDMVLASWKSLGGATGCPVVCYWYARPAFMLKWTFQCCTMHLTTSTMLLSKVVEQ